MTGSIPPGSNRTSTANCGSPGELLPPRALQDWVGAGGPAVYNATGNEFLGYLTYAGCSQVMQCSTLVAAQGGWLCRSPAT